MAKLPLLSGREVCQILQANGFVQVRQRGSHIIMQLEISGGTVTIPVPDHKELRIGTLRSIVRQSNLPVSAFVN